MRGHSWCQRLWQIDFTLHIGWCHFPRQRAGSSGSAVTFYRCQTEDELREDVANRKAECGYVISPNLEQVLTDNGTQNRPVITAYRRNDSTQTMLIDEMVASGMYEFIAFEILDEHVSKKTNRDARDVLKKKFDKYQNTQAFIEFQYADGSKNKSLSLGNANYMLLPVRGMIAILILLAGMTGTLFFYEDKKKNCFVWLRGRDSGVIPRLYLIAPLALAGIAGILSLFLTGLASSIGNELLTLFLYLITITVFCDFLRQILPRMELFLTVIPFFIGGSLILCPVFANLGDSLAIVSVLQKLTPVYYYLNALHSWQGKMVMVIFVGVIAIANRIAVSGKGSRFAQ